MLEALSDEELWLQTKSVFGAERKAVVSSLLHLREIERRKLDVDRGFGGLLEACMEEFRLSQTASFQRIACLRVITEIKEVEPLMIEGELTMSVVAMVRRFFRKEDDRGVVWSYERKLELIHALRGLTCKKAKELLVGINDEFTDPDGTDQVSPKMVRLRMHMKVEDHQKIQKLKSLYSHTHPGMTDAELFVMLVEKDLAKKDPAREPARPKASADVASDDAAVLPTEEVKLSKAIRRKVWQDAAEGCAWVSSKTGRRCGSHFMLEIDHIVPKAEGGTNELHNLRLCCDKHNRRRAEVRFGPYK